MKAAVVGVGGVGSFAAEVLARAGMSLLLIDPDRYEKKNVNQRFYSLSAEGKYKVDVASSFLSSFTDVEAFPSNVEDVSLGDVDIVVDCTDSRESRSSTYHKAMSARLPYAFASVGKDVGMVSVVPPGKEFHLLQKEGSTTSGGVAACALAGSLAAANALAFLKHGNAVVWEEVLIFNASTMSFERVIL